MGYLIKKNGIEMHHGNNARIGYVVKKSWGTEYYLIDFVNVSHDDFYYVAAWRCKYDNSLVITSLCVYPSDIVCKGKITTDTHEELGKNEFVKAEFSNWNK